ncbi:hypothetical protein WMF28_31455 [Sorangium sp. So ce590]|uniref:hypothetical protein n=1 Tax=Sorangium sp. So ce590 TaxID=3133317 RepID=UPI003F63B817
MRELDRRIAAAELELHAMKKQRDEMVAQEEAAATSNLGTVVRAIQAAIVSYATKVVGMVDEDDPATLETVRRALRPLDAHRESGARRAHGGTKGEAANGATAAPATGAGAEGGGATSAPA